ncbi:urotensin 2 domain containing [Amia ocellicauda]|uniref:urotensin 2 domain containing n=1 Tax=Amia ocellicauda TaxID=2972642 RepID=UPI003464377A
MESKRSANICFGLMALLLMNEVETVHGRAFLNEGNNLFRVKEDSDVQNKIIALLLQKSLLPIGRTETNGGQQITHNAKLEELEALKEDLDLQKMMASNVLGMELSFPSKRACFWKYCV